MNGQRIRQKRKEIGLTQKELGSRLGVTASTVTQWEKDITRPNGENLVALSKVLKTSPLWLTTGVAEDVIPYSVETPNYSIPLISWVSAGHWCESPDNYPPGDAEEWLPAPKNAGSKSFALRVINDSMTSPFPGQRSYPHGTIIYVDPDKPLVNGARVVARANGEYTFKSYIEDAGRKYLKPINPTYDKIDITEDVHICGVVIGSYMPE